MLINGRLRLYARKTKDGRIWHCTYIRCPDPSGNSHFKCIPVNFRKDILPGAWIQPNITPEEAFPFDGTKGYYDLFLVADGSNTLNYSLRLNNGQEVFTEAIYLGNFVDNGYISQEQQK